MTAENDVQETRRRQHERAYRLAERLEAIYTRRGDYKVAALSVNGSTINGIFKVAEAIRKEAQEIKQST